MGKYLYAANGKISQCECSSKIPLGDAIDYITCVVGPGTAWTPGIF